MADEKTNVAATEDREAEARREFLKKVATGSVAAPAVALLLAASAKSAEAAPQSLSSRPA